MVLDDPDAIIKLQNLAENGYRMAFLTPEKVDEIEQA
jgi:hypothetical protein